MANNSNGTIVSGEDPNRDFEDHSSEFIPIPFKSAPNSWDPQTGFAPPVYTSPITASPQISLNSSLSSILSYSSIVEAVSFAWPKVVFDPNRKQQTVVFDEYGSSTTPLREGPVILRSAKSFQYGNQWYLFVGSNEEEPVMLKKSMIKSCLLFTERILMLEEQISTASEHIKYMNLWVEYAERLEQNNQALEQKNLHLENSIQEMALKIQELTQSNLELNEMVNDLKRARDNSDQNQQPPQRRRSERLEMPTGFQSNQTNSLSTQASQSSSSNSWRKANSSNTYTLAPALSTPVATVVPPTSAVPLPQSDLPFENMTPLSRPPKPLKKKRFFGWSKTDGLPQLNPTTSDYTFKIVLVGDQGSGKSALLKRFTENSFTESWVPTLGMDFVRNVTSPERRNEKGRQWKEIEGERVKFQIFDYAGHRKFRPDCGDSDFRSAHGIMIEYNVTDKESFSDANTWFEMLIQNGLKKTPKMLVGCCSDLEESRKISYEQAYEYAASKKMKFLETSSKLGTNVEEAFTTMAKTILQRVKMFENQ